MPKNFVYINVKKKIFKKNQILIISTVLTIIFKSNFNNLNSANKHVQIKF